MTYNGIGIGRKPKFEQLREYLAHTGINLDAMEIYKYWEPRHWSTKKGAPIKTLEKAVSIVCSHIKREAEKLKNKEEQKKTMPIKKNKAQKKDRVLIPVASSLNTDNSWMTYKEQLQDKRWKAFRQFVFTVRGRWCEKCGSLYSLEIHHPTYFNGRKAWEYTCNEVQVLCDKCHKKEHGIEK